MTMEKTNHQIASEDSARLKEFHDEITHLQTQIQNIELAISDVYKSKKVKKKDNKDKKQDKKDKKLQSKVKEKKKNKKKSNRHHTDIK